MNGEAETWNEQQMLKSGL